jgi:hypothetical protein
MLKLLICIFGIFAISLGLLHARQERLALRHDINRLHDGIESSQGTLWNQQLDIAKATAPAVLKGQVKDLNMQPNDPNIPGPWMERRIFPDKNP